MEQERFDESFDVKYDNRFGHKENCIGTYWLYEACRDGEGWDFEFPNGYMVFVNRYRIFDGVNTRMTMGYELGHYQCELADEDCEVVETAEMEDHEEVEKYLEMVSKMHCKQND